MKKILAAILCIGMVVALATNAALAEAIAPFSVTQTEAFVSLSISGGNAKAVVSVSALPVGCSVSASVSLQKKVSNQWINVASAAGTRDASASAAAVKGTTYRAFALCKVYDSSGNLVDTLTQLSNTQTY